ncbi:MAG: hypothetical protein BWY72_01742 [Bacteroidetes bacterium ADurb.Bin416]|nr:MAG: hypothetical protein BWY72_01742 [Bacteroidetes bacterium ADurb.Bin416]
MLGFSLHGRIQLFVGEEIVQLDIADHGGFQEVQAISVCCGVITHKHVTGGAYEDGVNVDGA